MDELLTGFEQLKISAFTKLKYINNDINEVTIGPNCSRNQPDKPSIPDSPPKINKTVGVQDEVETETVYEKNVKDTLKLLDLQRKDELKKNIQKRVNLIEKFSKNQDEVRKAEWLRIQESFIEDVQRKENDILDMVDKYNKITSEEHAKLVQHYQALAEQKRQKELEIKEKENQRKILQANFEKVKKNQQTFRQVYQQIIPIFKKCTDNEELKNILGEDFKLLKTLPEKLEEVTNRCKSGRVTENEVLLSSKLVNDISVLKTKVEETVEKINNEKIQASQPKPEVIVPNISTPVKDQVEQLQVNIQPSQPSVMDRSILNQYISPINVNLYIESMTFLENHSKSFSELQNDPSQKQFIFNCKKSVNIPVNSLSGINTEHILDKYTRLHNLLTGRDIIVSDNRFNASKHPQGIAFCKDLLAKKFVLQGDLMVSSNAESAMSYATVIVSLWNDFPDFGQLLLAYFYKSCPYLVPYYIPKQVDMSDEVYYKKRGYQYTEGQIEKQDKFLKRMTGIIRLYAAVLIIKPKRGQNTNPHNLQNGWRLLTSTLKLEPQVDITATLLHTFLETAGFHMEMKYGKMFRKLLQFIAQHFLPKCSKKCTGGATTRLELLLTEYFKNRKFDPPRGYIGYNYW